MKKSVLKSLPAVLLILLCNKGFSQNDYPESYFNIGLGLGPNYGGIGTKSVIGYKNSGLLVGLGIFGENLGYEVGGQISYKWLFANLGYGVYGTAESLIDIKLIKGGILMTGVMITIGKAKRFFIDLGIGYDWGGTYIGDLGEKKKFNTIDGEFGLGFRLGNWKNLVESIDK